MVYMYADYQIVYSGIQQVANNLPYYSAECKLHICISLARAVKWVCCVVFNRVLALNFCLLGLHYLSAYRWSMLL